MDQADITPLQWSLFAFWERMGQSMHVWNSISCSCGPKFQRTSSTRWMLGHRSFYRQAIEL